MPHPQSNNNNNEPHTSHKIISSESNGLTSEVSEKFGSGPLGLSDNKYFEQQRQQNKKLLWAIFSLLLVLAISVIFILPRYVATQKIEPTLIAIEAESSNTKINTVSPFEEAQMLQKREEAQAVLATLLEIQKSLQSKYVEEWQPQEFALAIAQAQAGDSAYSQQDFLDAKTSYQLSLNMLQSIEANRAVIFTQYMEQGDTAILSGNATTANEAYAVAIKIDPDNPAAQLGHARSQQLNRVIELLNQAEVFHSQQQFESAQELYQQALIIDPVHVRANKLMAQIELTILERDFAIYMSQGYASIQAGSPVLAESSFKQALSLKPNANEALTALELASTQITSSTINVLLRSAQNHEANENWLAAISSYDEITLLDANLVSATEGRNRSNSRNNLDQFLISTLADPLRLANSEVFKQVTQVYKDANAMTSNGPRLIEQLQKIFALLGNVTKPVEISFVSDNLTNVTIYKVAELGQFTSQTLSLTPGVYVAVGVRDGFRDVRREFTIAINNKALSITVQCNEEI